MVRVALIYLEKRDAQDYALDLGGHSTTLCRTAVTVTA